MAKRRYRVEDVEVSASDGRTLIVTATVEPSRDGTEWQVRDLTITTAEGVPLWPADVAHCDLVKVQDDLCFQAECLEHRAATRERMREAGRRAS